MSEKINLTEDRLREWGFRYEQGDRQPSKHWILWLAPACVEPYGKRMFACVEDLGVEIASIPGGPRWHCWIRSDYAGRYTRFLHVRQIATERDLVSIIEALTGRSWIPSDVLYGAFRSPEEAKELRARDSRLDNTIAAHQMRWQDNRNGSDPSQIGIINK